EVGEELFEQRRVRADAQRRQTQRKGLPLFLCLGALYVVHPFQNVVDLEVLDFGLDLARLQLGDVEQGVEQVVGGVERHAGLRDDVLLVAVGDGRRQHTEVHADRLQRLPQV